MRILVLNCGGATFKFKLLLMPEETLLARGTVDRFGPEASFHMWRPGQADELIERPITDHLDGLRFMMQTLTQSQPPVLESLHEIGAVAHKLAHGGERYREAVRIDDEVLATLEILQPLVPLHNPPNVAGIRAIASLLPQVPQFGSFETGFHQTVPRHAWIYGLPFAWYEQHQVRKYGFHSASHRYVASRVPVRHLISCHLGSGTSVCAIRDGHSLDISSGLTPQSGTMMSTRSGDFDPFVIPYMMRELNLPIEEIERTLVKESGLLGISGLSGDLRDLEAAARAGHPQAVLALEAFCYQIRRHVGAAFAELGGLDAMVFTGGIGEHSALIRSQVCRPLSHLGIDLDPEANEVSGAERIISPANSPVTVHVIRADEEIMVARDAFALYHRQ